MRTLAPADSLIYLETNDLAAAVQPIIDSKPFTEVAISKPDFSALKGVQLAIAVTGFELSEEKLNDEQSIGRIQPRFVAIADTHAWNWEAVAFAEQRLGGFVAKIYGAEPTLEQSAKHGGKYFTWTLGERKAHALVIESLIWFGNDETAIEKSLAVRRGDGESITKKLGDGSAAHDVIVSGHVLPEGVTSIASLISLKAASQTNVDPNRAPNIADALAILIRDSVVEISWNARRTSSGIEDIFVATLPSVQRRSSSGEMIAELVDSSFEEIEATPGEDVARAITDVKPDAVAPSRRYRREDRFTDTTAERRIITDLGFLGWMIVQLSPQEESVPE